MPRTAILLTLIAATFLGPLLCCCALGLTCSARVQPDRPTAVVDTGACPHCQPAGPTAPESKHDCPVCEKRSEVTTYVEVKPAPLPAAPAFIAWLPLDQFLPVESFPATVEVAPLPDPRTYFLDACHRLRC